jgi:hypothetical protein
LAKAVGKPTTRLLLKDARARVVGAVHARHYAEKLIVKWIVSGRLPWGYEAWDGHTWAGMSADGMIRALWSKPYRVDINWEESFASMLVTFGGARFYVYGLWVAAERLKALLKPLRTTKEAVKRQSLRQQMLQTILRRLYPRGVSESTTTADVTRQVEGEWSAECDARGVNSSRVLAPKWDMVARALGRRN